MPFLFLCLRHLFHLKSSDHLKQRWLGRITKKDVPTTTGSWFIEWSFVVVPSDGKTA